MLAERLTGVGAPMQASSTGSSSKRGVYNAAGTMAMLSEGNQRQHTNIRDFRDSLSRVASSAMAFQRANDLKAEDPTIGFFNEEMQGKIRAALAAATPAQLMHSRFEVKTSDSGANQEVERSNLMQMAALLSQYGQQTLGMAAQLAKPNLNPVIKETMLRTVAMQREMARQLLRAFDQLDMEEKVVDLERIFSEEQRRQQQQQGNGQAAFPGGVGQPGVPVDRRTVEAVSQVSIPGI
jgi:hypothetical protein